MLPIITHYKNKYPGGSVRSSDSAIDVYDASGEHVVALRKNGADQLVCQSKQLGCRDVHDLAPIPKDARVHKCYKDGRIAPSEEAASRRKVQKELAECEVGPKGCVPSIHELHKSLRPHADPDSGFDHNTSYEGERGIKTWAPKKA